MSSTREQIARYFAGDTEATPAWDGLSDAVKRHWLSEADAMLRDIPALADLSPDAHEWRCPNCGAVTRARMADQ